MAHRGDATEQSYKREDDDDGAEEPVLEGACGGVEGDGEQDERQHEVERREAEGAEDGVDVAEEGKRGAHHRGECYEAAAQEEARDEVARCKLAFLHV